MEWIDRNLRRRRALRCQQVEAKRLADKLASNGEGLWESLRQTLKDSVKAYIDAGAEPGHFDYDGRNHHVFFARYVLDESRDAFHQQAPEEKRKVIVTLDAQENTIAAQYTGPEIQGRESRTVSLYLDDAESVRLRKDRNDQPINVLKAAEYLLDPFLFPDLIEPSE